MYGAPPQIAEHSVPDWYPKYTDAFIFDVVALVMQESFSAGTVTPPS